MNNLAGLSLGEAEFRSIRQLVLANTGISLGESKRELVKRRFTPRLKKLGLLNFSSYISYMQQNRETELTDFCNAITTNLTSFFRENHHYEFLKTSAIPAIVKRNSAGSKKMRVWSAGCSTGQEAYCLAITLKSAIPGFDSWDVKLLATDLDEKCLAVAKAGIYKSEGMESIPEQVLGKYFEEIEDTNPRRNSKTLEVSTQLKKLISFKKLNLINPTWPMKGKFDVIFCRNVFIYFDRDTQNEVVRRYAALQSRGSYLCIGHSETIHDPAKLGYRLVGKTAYIRE